VEPGDLKAERGAGFYFPIRGPRFPGRQHR